MDQFKNTATFNTDFVGHLEGVVLCFNNANLTANRAVQHIVTLASEFCELRDLGSLSQLEGVLRQKMFKAIRHIQTEAVKQHACDRNVDSAMETITHAAKGLFPSEGDYNRLIIEGHIAILNASVEAFMSQEALHIPAPEQQ